MGRSYGIWARGHPLRNPLNCYSIVLSILIPRPILATPKTINNIPFCAFSKSLPAEKNLRQFFFTRNFNQSYTNDQKFTLDIFLTQKLA